MQMNDFGLPLKEQSNHIQRPRGIVDPLVSAFSMASQIDHLTGDPTPEKEILECGQTNLNASVRRRIWTKQKHFH
jgi:hypothetical protein